MDAEEIARLKTHVLQIASSFVHEISSHNVILSLDEKSNAHPDPVSNHHLIAFLTEIDSGMFVHYRTSLFDWLSKRSNGYSDHPFTLDSYTLFCERSEENNALFRSQLLSHKLKDGSIPIFTSLIDGGDFFSTLWAVKIMINYDSELFESEIESSLSYLLDRTHIASRSMSQTGFLFYLLLRFKPEKYRKQINGILADVLEAIRPVDFTEHLVMLITSMYILEDLIEYYGFYNDEQVKSIIESKVTLLFQLDRDPTLPDVFEKWKKTRPQSGYYHFMLRSGVIALKYLKRFHDQSFALELNAHLHGTCRKALYLGMRAEHELKEYKKQYESIQDEFSRYDSRLQSMWEATESDYNRSIFIMMPLKSSIGFNRLTETIKNTCDEHGFKAFRVDDDGRKPNDTLWDNIVINMLGCKYGIAVYVTENAEVEESQFFENPNVALEYGFMKSRGKKVLTLKDVNSNPPADLRGLYWRSFEISNPLLTVPSVLEEWLNELIEAEHDLEH